MKASRHPHPHIDPRQPGNGSAPRTNPPIFVWKPAGEARPFRLTVARDAELADVVIDEASLTEPVHLPEKALEPGSYHWKWSQGDSEGEVFAFTIAPDAVTVEVPSSDVWLERFGTEHPRLFVRPDELDALRSSRAGGRADPWAALEAAADELLAEPHEIYDPQYLPDRRLDYQAFFEPWLKILQDSRRFVKGAESLALAYLASGEKRYARAACERMASVSMWDPDGASHLSHNDEAHMSVIWHGAKACDWVWDHFTDEERERVIEQFRRRGEITFEHMHGRGSYGVTRFDSHAGREIVFLALLGIVFHEHIPGARQWLDWLRPVLCGIWPIWAGDDGAWAEGPSYGLAYVQIMTMFATALKHGAGVDLYRRPFWKGHAEWRRQCFPPYVEWMGFGDHSERGVGNWLSNADLVEIIGRQTGTGEFDRYVAAFRAEAAKTAAEKGSDLPKAVNAQLYLLPPAGDAPSGGGPDGGRVLSVFPGAGRAAVRTTLADPSKDVALIFRSSPYGSVSHSHASNNDFILHVAGKVMAMPSGYYCGYGSDHHAHWVWHTKSHNCVTLSDASQRMRSHDSAGAVESAFEDDLLAYFLGNADSSYQDQAERCRRHVIFLKSAQCFVMVDEFAGRPGVVSALQWNLHSWDRFDVDEEARRFRLERDGSTLAGHFMCHVNSFFSLSEGWDPPMMETRRNDEWRDQYHLRFTVSGLVSDRRLGVVLAPGHAGLKAVEVTTERDGDVEIARVADATVLVADRPGIEHGDVRSDAAVAVAAGGNVYHVTDAGVKR